MRRTAIVGAVVAAALSMVPASARATPPTREPLGDEDFVLTDHCTFDIAVEFVQNREVLTTYYDASGEFVRQSVTGVPSTPCSSTSPARRSFGSWRMEPGS
jgi:hypothetical protein